MKHKTWHRTIEDDYSEEAMGRVKDDGGVRVKLPDDGVKPESLHGPVTTIKVNPRLTKGEVEVLRLRIKENDGYCPCAINRNKDTRCMCKEFLESTESGECHCGLYLKTIERV